MNPSGVLASTEKKEQWEGLFAVAKEKGFQEYRPHIFHKEPKWFRFISDGFSKFLDREDIQYFMASFREDHLLHTLLPKNKSAMWLIWGAHDTIVPAAWSQDWMRLNPKTRSIIINDSGHSPHVETPLLTVQLILKILNGKTVKDGSGYRFAIAQS